MYGGGRGSTSARRYELGCVCLFPCGKECLHRAQVVADAL
eukprot:COSAG02_NODE_17456_length_1002_cov_0.880399_1_plen_39_part_10